MREEGSSESKMLNACMVWCYRKEQRPTTPVGPPPVLVDQLVDRKVKVGDKARLTIKGKHCLYVFINRGLNFVIKVNVYKIYFTPLVIFYVQYDNLQYCML